MAALELSHTPVALLDGLSPEETRRLSLLFSRRTYPPGADIIRQGEPCHHLFVLEIRSLIVQTVQRGVLARLGPGSSVGEVTLFTDAEASATVTAATETVVWAAPHAQMRAAIEEYPALARNFCRLLSGRLSTSSQKAEHSGVTLLVGLVEETGPGVAMTLAASLAYHLQQEVALLDLSSKASGECDTSPPTLERPLEGLVLCRAEGRAEGRLAFWLEGLTRQYAHVLVWAPEGVAEEMAPLLGMTDRALVMVSHQSCRRTDYRAWRTADSTLTELVVVDAPEPRCPAASEAIEGDTGLTVAALLPAVPEAMKRAIIAPDRVLRHREEPFARGIARLARRLVGKRVGVALGAGAGRGHGHIWVLRALEQLGVYPDVVAGTSIGACMAGYYALGASFEEMERGLQGFAGTIRRWSLPLYPLIAGAAMDRFFSGILPHETQIEEFSLPCAFVATDFFTGEEVVLRRGCAWRSGRASCSIPGVFPPMHLEGRLLVDGGVVSPVPCRAARDLGADVVIGVSLEVTSGARTAREAEPSPGRRRPTWPEVTLRSYDLLQRGFTRQCLAEADVAIRVFTPLIHPLDVRGGPAFVEAAERAVEVASDSLHALLPWIRRAT